jgi:acyl-CoA thioester hydrolase
MSEAQSEGPGHVWPVRVYFEDTDAGGVVYYANYLKFIERARTEMLRAKGWDHLRLAQEHGVSIVVRNCALEYVAPARLDDALEVRSRITKIGGATLAIRQEVVRAMSSNTELGGSGPTLLVGADVRLACVDAAFQPVRLPEALRRAFSHIKAIEQ